jgi:hypothetical protein
VNPSSCSSICLRLYYPGHDFELLYTLTRTPDIGLVLLEDPGSYDNALIQISPGVEADVGVHVLYVDSTNASVQVSAMFEAV